jgi:anti-anti-sigma factor
MSHLTAPGAFSVDVSIVGDDAVATVRGEVDMVTAAALGGAVDAMIERGQRHLVLDLAQLEFIDAAGLRVFAATLGRLRDVGATVVFRSLPPTLQVSRLAAVVPLQRAEDARPEPPRPASAPQFDHSLARAAADRARRDVLYAALNLVVVLARATVVGADGVSVSLAGEGRLITVASSDDTVEAMDADQYVTGEGPCLTADRDTTVIVKASEDVPAGTELRFARNGNARASVDLSALRRGGSLRIALPMELCKGLADGRLELQVAEGGYVVRSDGPIALRC